MEMNKVENSDFFPFQFFQTFVVRQHVLMRVLIVFEQFKPFIKCLSKLPRA